MEDIAELLEDSYGRMNVWQALVVVGTDAENDELAGILQGRGFPVLPLTYAAMQDNNGGSTQSTQSTHGVPSGKGAAARVLVLTYAAWWQQVMGLGPGPGLEEVVYPHNLLLLDPDLDSPAQDRVLQWVGGCVRRGFWKEGPYRFAIGNHLSDLELKADA